MTGPRKIVCETGAPIAEWAGTIIAAERREGLDEARHHPAVKRMIEQHSRVVYRVAYSALRNWADAEDVVQETFLQLLRGSPDRLAEGAIEEERGYLARIAWRLAARHKRRPRSADLSEEILRAHPSGDRDPEQGAVDGDFEAWLHRRIDELPPRLRQPLTLAALGELTSPQIALVLGIPEGSVRRRIHNARQILKRQMERRER